jgi:hypothetical protein
MKAERGTECGGRDEVQAGHQLLQKAEDEGRGARIRVR